jgi:hypothetical protein
MDRWVLRVAAYVALMTDRYPPFRLDMGGTDPGTRPIGPGGPPPAGPAAVEPPGPAGPAAWTPPPSRPASGWSAGPVIAVVVGALLLLASSGLLVGGAALAWVDTTQREDGFVRSSGEDLTTNGYALLTEDVTLDTAGDEWVIDDVLGDARLEVTPADPGSEIFVGVARSSDASSYLDGVGTAVLDEIGSDGDPRTTEREGGPPSASPDEEDIWVAQAQGSGTQTLTWTPADGDWTAVVMNADASAGLDVEAASAPPRRGCPGCGASCSPSAWCSWSSARS